MQKPEITAFEEFEAPIERSIFGMRLRITFVANVTFGEASIWNAREQVVLCVKIKVESAHDPRLPSRPGDGANHPFVAGDPCSHNRRVDDNNFPTVAIGSDQKKI